MYHHMKYNRDGRPHPHCPATGREEKRADERALELLSDVRHGGALCGPEAGSLPYGQQRKLEIVRALATNPKHASCSTSRPPA